MNNTIKKYVSLALRLIIAIIYVQTLYYKFSGHKDSVYIFTQLGLEPYGRIGIGIFELITAILILIPRSMIFGAILSIGVISGALFSHLGPLGIEVNGDGGKVFYLALAVFLASVLILILHWKELILTFNKVKNKILK